MLSQKKLVELYATSQELYKIINIIFHDINWTNFQGRKDFHFPTMGFEPETV